MIHQIIWKQWQMTNGKRETRRMSVSGTGFQTKLGNNQNRLSSPCQPFPFPHGQDVSLCELSGPVRLAVFKQTYSHGSGWRVSRRRYQHKVGPLCAPSPWAWQDRSVVKGQLSKLCGHKIFVPLAEQANCAEFPGNSAFRIVSITE
jgi:hypothetical protein